MMYVHWLETTIPRAFATDNMKTLHEHPKLYETNLFAQAKILANKVNSVEIYG